MKAQGEIAIRDEYAVSRPGPGLQVGDDPFDRSRHVVGDLADELGERHREPPSNEVGSIREEREEQNRRGQHPASRGDDLDDPGLKEREYG